MKAIKAVRLLVCGQIADPYLKWEQRVSAPCRKAMYFLLSAFHEETKTPSTLAVIFNKKAKTGHKYHKGN